MTTCRWCAENLPEPTPESCPHCGSRLTDDGRGGSAPPVPADALPPPPMTYTHSGVRYVLGYDATDYIVSDRLAPGAPPRRFPRNDEGWTQAWISFVALEPNAQAIGSAAASAPVVPTAPAGLGMPRARTNGMAVAAMVTGILFIPIIPIVLGHVSKREIDRSAGTQDGRGMAIAGIVLGWATVGLIVFAMVAAGIVFAFVGGEVMQAVRDDADARSLLDNAIVEVQEWYRDEGSFTDLRTDDPAGSALEWNRLPYPEPGAVSIHDAGFKSAVLVTRTELGGYYCAAIDSLGVEKGWQNAMSEGACEGGWRFTIPSLEEWDSTSN